MTDTDNTTLKILLDALGNLSQYHSSGWFWHSTEDNGKWMPTGKTQIYPYPAYRPNVNPRCYCNTPIKRHFLIIDKDENHHFVGSECVKLFGEHHKVCLGCQRRYRGSYKYCKECRDRGLTSFSDEKLGFGKYENRKPTSLLGVDDGYIHFLFKCDTVSEASKQDLARNLLPQTIIGTGKYHDKSIQWIKANAVGYYNWLKTSNKPYAKYLN